LNGWLQLFKMRRQLCQLLERLCAYHRQPINQYQVNGFVRLIFPNRLQSSNPRKKTFQMETQ
jgi:hypothetical protein